MTKSRLSTSLILLCGVLAACGQSSSQSTPKQPGAPAPESRLEQTSNRSDAPDTPPEAALRSAVASPVSGPALDDLPPPAPRSVEQSKIDLTALVEPPQMVIDGHGHTGKVKALLYTHDGRQLVTAGHDKTVRIWSAKTGELLRTIYGEQGVGPAGRLFAAALSGDDQWLAVAGFLGSGAHPTRSSRSSSFDIRLLDFPSGTTEAELKGHSDVVLALSFAAQSGRLLSGGGDRRAIIWDAAAARPLHHLTGHADSVLSVAWSPREERVATGSADGTVRVYDSRSGALHKTLTDLEGGVTSLAFTPSGRTVVAGTDAGLVRLYSAETGEFQKTLADVGVGVGSLSISASGLAVLVTTVGAPYASHVYNINSGKRLTSHVSHDNVVLASAISPNGRWAATAGGNRFEIDVWDLQSGVTQIHTSGHGRPMWSVGFARDSRSIAWGAEFDQRGLGQYQLNGPLAHRLDFTGPRPLEVSTVGQNQSDFLRAIETASNVEVRTPTGKDHEQLDVWSGGRRRLSIRRGVDSGFVHRTFSLNPDGKIVLTGGDNGVLETYDTTSGRRLRSFEGHTGDILSVAISPDGRYAVSGASDQTVRLWELEAGRLLLSLFHARNGEWVAFTGSGYYASSAYGDAYLGWVLGQGPARTAGYLPASALSAQLRFEPVVRHFVRLGGEIEAAIAASNGELPPETPKVSYFRFDELPQFAPPDIYYLDPGNDLRIDSDRIEVTARAYSPSGASIAGMTFLVNGRPVDAIWQRHVGAPRLRLMGREAELSAILPLPEKQNRISVVAENAYNRSVPVSFEVERTGGAKELEKLYQPELYLLSIGISDYGSPQLAPLAYGHADAEALVQTLTKQNRRLYERVETKLLTGRTASLPAIGSGLSWLSRASQKDLVIVYLSGYAARTSNGDYYFLAHDSDPKRLTETAVSWRELRRALEALPARVLLFIDSSHAGAATEGPDSRLDIAELLRHTARAESSIVVFSSSTGAEASYESDSWKHGAFTKALLEGLAGLADYDRNRQVSIKEIEHFVRRRVIELTSNRQHPSSVIPGTIPNFPISDRP